MNTFAMQRMIHAYEIWGEGEGEGEDERQGGCSLEIHAVYFGRYKKAMKFLL